MGPVLYGRQLDKNFRTTSPSFVDNSTHYRQCRCGCVIVWGYPNVFKRRHVLPIMDDGLVLGEA